MLAERVSLQCLVRNNLYKSLATLRVYSVTKLHSRTGLRERVINAGGFVLFCFAFFSYHIILGM